MAASSRFFADAPPDKIELSNVLIIEDNRPTAFMMGKFMMETYGLERGSLHFAIDAEDARRRFIYVMINAKLVEQNEKYKKIITEEMRNHDINYDLICFDVRMPEEHYRGTSQLSTEEEAKIVCTFYAPNTFPTKREYGMFLGGKSKDNSPEIFAEENNSNLELIEKYRQDFCAEYIMVKKYLAAHNLDNKHKHLGPGVMRDLIILETYFGVTVARKIFFSTEPKKDYILCGVLNSELYGRLKREDRQNDDKSLIQDLAQWNDILQEYGVTLSSEEEMARDRWLIEEEDFQLITPPEIKDNFTLKATRTQFKKLMADHGYQSITNATVSSNASQNPSAETDNDASTKPDMPNSNSNSNNSCRP